MTTKTVCDRCDTEIKPKGYGIQVNTPTLRRSISGSGSSSFDTYTTPGKADLCDDCIRSFNNWWDER